MLLRGEDGRAAQGGVRHGCMVHADSIKTGGCGRRHARCGLLPCQAALLCTCAPAHRHLPPLVGHGLTFRDPIEALPACLEGAQAEGASIIVALTHMGAEADFGMAYHPAAHAVDLIVGEQSGAGHKSCHGLPWHGWAGLGALCPAQTARCSSAAV